MIEVDVVIIGAGPAGATAGLALAPHARVLLVDRSEPVTRIGESLVPAARRILHDLGLLESFERDRHPAYLGNRSHWGGSVQETDFLRDPDGPGWHLDRVRFESFLRRAAATRGCRVLVPARLDRIEASSQGWSVRVSDGRDQIELGCRVVIDATGRAASLARRLGARRLHEDRLAARWVRGQVARETSRTAGFSTVESSPEGWWYSAPLADGARVLAFHGDADLVFEAESEAELLARARRSPGIAELLAGTGFMPTGGVANTAANSSRSEPIGQQAEDSGWLAIGDAALAFDPLASRGLFNALFTGLAGALTASRMLTGEPDALAEYSEQINRIHSAYGRHLALCYAAETRWPTHPFWARRGSGSPGS